LREREKGSALQPANLVCDMSDSQLTTIGRLDERLNSLKVRL
jgi:hypothetical protein